MLISMDVFREIQEDVEEFKVTHDTNGIHN